MNRPSDRAIAQVAEKIYRLADVIRKHGFCPPVALDTVADELKAALAAAPEGAQGAVADFQAMARHFDERAKSSDPQWKPHHDWVRYRDLCLRLAVTPHQPTEAARDREDAGLVPIAWRHETTLGTGHKFPDEFLAKWPAFPVAVEDAERYRWLRDEFDPSVDDEILWLSGENFDAAIDAARAAGGGGSHA